MNLKRLKDRIKTNADMTLEFWEWKADIEKTGKHHILDDKYFEETRDILLEQLPKWQTYRNALCNYKSELPKSLKAIRNHYDEIRTYSLLNFDKVPKPPLKMIWHELGRVKEGLIGEKRTGGDYYVIAVCKPLLFLWGQTPPLDSINRREIRRDITPFIKHPYSVKRSPNQFRMPRTARWDFSSWYRLMLILQSKLKENPEIIQYCTKKFSTGSIRKSLIPWGRFLDIYYYER